tara:strand:- start:951 stop:1163 length:213 start_codon:yes stop_codon:yes gene_type:complete
MCNCFTSFLKTIFNFDKRSEKKLEDKYEGKPKYNKNLNSKRPGPIITDVEDFTSVSKIKKKHKTPINKII